MNNSVQKIHIWMPNFFSFEGGIQAYSVNLLSALQNILPSVNYRVFSMHDREVVRSCARQYSSQTRFYCYGSVPSRIRKSVYAAELLRYGAIDRPDLIMTTHLSFSPVAKMIWRIASVPYWVSAHGTDAWDISNPRLKSALQAADKILPVSDYTRARLLREQTLSTDNVRSLPNTFDVNRFQIAPKPDYLLKRYGLGPDQPVILTVGRLAKAEAYKGYDTVLRSLPNIIKDHPTVHYLLIGKGDDTPRIQTLVHRLNLKEHVTLTGFVPDAELSDHYNLCDVFAMPSKGEGFGIVYLEAIASGKPTIGGNQDGAVDALCNGELGVLVNPDSPAEIATVLSKVLAGTFVHSLLYKPEKLRQKVIERFGPESFQQILRAHLYDFSPAAFPE